MRVGRVAPHEDPVLLNAIYILVMALLSVVMAPVFEADTLRTLHELVWTSETVLSLLYLAPFSNLAAFGLQLLGQHHLPPTPATIVTRLETPIGVLAAVVLLNELMGGWQWVGSGLEVGWKWVGPGLALVAVVLTVAGERHSARQQTAN